MIISVNEVARLIGLAPDQWKGQCYVIAKMCIEMVLTEVTGAKLRYGHYTGPISHRSMFRTNIKAGFCQHGWVELPDGQVYDPTRWVFEDRNPYIYVGSADQYDIGGQAIRNKFRGPAPAHDLTGKQVVLPLDEISMGIARSMLNDMRPDGGFDMYQVWWLATEDPKRMGVEFSKKFYKALDETGNLPLVPIDNRRYVEEHN